MLGVQTHNNNRGIFFTSKVQKILFIWIFSVIVLYLSTRSYYIFHSIVEGGCLVIAVNFAILTCNIYKHKYNSGFIFIGVSYGFLSVLIFLHMVSYDKNPNFSKQIMNLSWYFEGIALLISILLTNKKVEFEKIVYFNSIIFTIFLFSIVVFKIYPICYVENIGESLFNTNSRYVVSIILLVNLLLVNKYKRYFPSNIVNLIYFYLFFKIFYLITPMLLSFDLKSSYIISEFFKLISFCLMYRCNIKEGFKKTINKIIENKDYHRNLIELLPNGVCVLRNDIITFSNETFTNILGAKRNDTFKNMSVYDFLHSGYYRKLDNAIIKAKKGIVSKNIEMKAVRINGEIIDIQLTITPLLVEEGEMLVVIKDITKDKENERELIETREEYEKLLELLPEGVAVINQGKIEYANKKWAEYVGANSPNDIIGKYHGDFMKVHPDYKEISSEKVRKVVKEKKEVEFFEKKVIRSDNTVIDMEFAGVPLINKNGIALLCVARDMSDRKNAEKSKKRLMEAMEISKLKSEFFANISHELKTPINVILGSVQLLMLYVNSHKSDDNNVKKYSKVIKQNCYRLIRLVNNLVDSTKIDSGYFKLQKKNVNIVSVIENITLSVANYAENKGINVIFDTVEEEIVTACDSDKIERIVLNLLSNAIKFTDSGGKIEVIINKIDNNINISVKDTGVGIPEDRLNDVFEMYHQIDKTLKRNRQGSGIGLSLVKSLVELHGGKISVDSKLGKGSEFIIKMPIEILDEKEDEINNEYEIDNNNCIEKINIEFSDIYS
ncbi:ATP-binding protein [Dethiothermospora halolimnae]|uniref:ATP-binding protein n=1 Tax=Dethiothermospora halolimnae TaxID=3114390 RepID=UPI003CCC2F58